MEPATATRLKSVFQAYDASGDGVLSFEELRNVLKSLSSFKDTEVRSVFTRIDSDEDGFISFDEFVDWIKRSDKKDRRAITALAPASDDGLSAVFYNFCGERNSDMDGKSFQKLCFDLGLIDKTLPASTVDLIFAKVAEKGRRRIDFQQFQAALEMLAEKKGSSIDDLREKLLMLDRPRHSGTHAENVRLAEVPPDRSPNRTSSLTASGQVEGRRPSRSPCRTSTLQASTSVVDARRPSRDRLSTDDAIALANGERRQASKNRSASKNSPERTETVRKTNDLGTLEGAFVAFCSHELEMDGRDFARVCKDCNLFDKKFCHADVDLIFPKLCIKGQRRIRLKGFEEGLWLIAEKKGVDYGEVLGAVASSKGPIVRGTQADAVRLADDAKGGTRTRRPSV